MNTTQQKPSAILRAAARLIEERGLSLGRYEDDDGRMCAVGAIRHACCGQATVGGSPMPCAEPYDSARRFMQLAIPNVHGWSDAAARANTPHVVIDGLRRAAELAESEGR